MGTRGKLALFQASSQLLSRLNEFGSQIPEGGLLPAAPTLSGEPQKELSCSANWIVQRQKSAYCLLSLKLSLSSLYWGERGGQGETLTLRLPLQSLPAFGIFQLKLPMDQLLWEK